MKKIAIAVFGPLLITGCRQTKKHTLTINNLSERKFDSVVIQGRGTVKIVFPELGVGGSAMQSYEVPPDTVFTDAVFMSRFYAKDTLLVQDFGYHSSAADVPEAMKLTVTKELRIVQQ